MLHTFFMIFLNFVLDLIFLLKGEKETNNFNFYLKNENEEMFNTNLKTSMNFKFDLNENNIPFDIMTQQNSSQKIENIEEVQTLNKIGDENLSKNPQKEDRKIQKGTPGKNSARADVVRKSLIRGVKRYFSKIMCQGDPLIKSVFSERGLECLRKIDEVHLLLKYFS